jgi:preprotein translocase subunit SecD
MCGIAVSVLALAACGGFGVEQYREAGPRSTLELRRVAATDRADAEHLPRLDGEGTVALEPGAVLRASHVAHVQLLESGEGERLVVLQLHDEGRVRLREATATDEGRRLALVADGRVIATPTVRGVLDQNEIAVRVERAHVEAAYAALTP